MKTSERWNARILGLFSLALLAFPLLLRATDGATTNPPVPPVITTTNPPVITATSPPVVILIAPDPTALAGTSSASFTLIRDGSTNAALTVDLTISGSASNGVDYAQIASQAIIPVGFLATDIPVQPKVVNRGNTTVVLTVQSNAAYTVGRPRRARVEIIDDTFNIPPPTVALTSPTNGDVFGAPADITLQADASDSDSPIQRVCFYVDDFFLGSVTNSPYTLTWSNVPPGRFVVFARAVDQVGQSTFSAGVQLTVTNADGTWHRHRHWFGEWEGRRR